MILRLESITKTFESFQLQRLNLEIDRGEFFSLLGPSGCGKTTVLRLIGGFESPDAGEIILNDKNITRLPPHQRNVHTVFQRYALFPHLTVFENVAFPLRLKKHSSSEIAERVQSTLKMVEIEDLQNRAIHQISGGQAQRTALARSLVGRPDVLLLDEPLSALDPELRMKMREELKTICKKVGITFILVTHDQEEALQLSDRIAVFRKGQCLQVGTPKAIYEDPNDAFIAKFIGAVNELSGEVQELSHLDGTTQLVLNSNLGTFKLKRNGQPYPKDICLILRPEKMRLLRSRSHTQENLLEGEIGDLTYLGSRTEYSVKIGASVFKVYEQELERQKKRSLNVGDRIFLAWRSEDAIVLPQNS